MRKIVIPVIVLIMLLLGGAAWWFLGRGTEPTQPPITGTLPEEGTGPAGEATGTPSESEGSAPSSQEPATQSILTKIGRAPTLAYALTRNGSMRLIEKTGRITLVSSSSEPITESSLAFEHISSAFFVDNGTKAVIAFGAPGTKQASVFDAGTKKWSALPSGIVALTPSPSDARIAYTTESAAATTISLLDLKTSGLKPKPIYSLAALDLALQWNLPGMLDISERPSAFYKGSSWSLSLNSLALAPLITEERGGLIKWNSSGTLGLAFSGGTGMRGGTLRLISRAGTTERTLSFASFPSKCDFGTALLPLPPRGTSTAPLFREDLSLYCAVPNDQRTLGTVPLPDTYLQRSLFTNDTFYRVSLSDGGATKLFTPRDPMDAYGLRVASGTLYFINRYDEFLYSLSLPE